jgi:processing peptidase subunit beta
MSEYAYTVTPWEIEMVRNKLKANVLMGLDNTAQTSEDIGRQLLTHGRRIHPTEMLARIDGVDQNALRGCITKYFIDRDHVAAALGATHEIPDYIEMRRRSYWLRY